MVEKHFRKIIYKGKIEFSRGLEEIWRGEEKFFLIYVMNKSIKLDGPMCEIHMNKSLNKFNLKVSLPSPHVSFLLL
jgi:hypothetical protein